MNERLDPEALLRVDAERPVPAPDPAFVAALGERLARGAATSSPTSDRAADATVVPFTRRARRYGGGVVVAGTLAFASVAAAAAGVIVTHPFRDDPPATTAVVSTVVETTSTSEAPTTEVGTSTVPATEPVTVPSTLPATVPPTVPRTEPPATVPPTAAPTTEATVPATITLECLRDGSIVRCSWSPGPDGTAGYAILRKESTAPSGTVTKVGADVTTWTDPAGMPVTPGVSVSYVVHALSSTGTSLAHSSQVILTCC